jgi:flagellar hook protein FlgE
MWQSARAAGRIGVHWRLLPKGNVMGISALSAGVSGLTANQRALDVAAHNVANANTAGFAPQRASFQEAGPAGTGVTLSVQGQALSGAAQTQALQQAQAGERPSGTDLAKELGNSLVYKAQAALSLKVVQAADERLGTLIDTKA